ncbi:MAG: c-type cytochrome [Deltaproteobacteria bacterium]|nr:c-type cytochrome [Deltaproteobacteria bacterium]
MSEKDELREHEFDGIQEYDNDLPRWWVWLFWITIIISVIYPFVYDFGPGQFASESVDAEVAELMKSRAALVTGNGSDELSLLRLASDQEALSSGREIYATRCAACHAEAGQGLIGPNLTDDNWLHGGKITDLHRVVVNGVLEKGMVPWKDQLSPEQLNSVVAFVWSLHGTNPPNPKAPEGDKVVRE